MAYDRPGTAAVDIRIGGRLGVLVDRAGGFKALPDPGRHVLALLANRRRRAGSAHSKCIRPIRLWLLSGRLVGAPRLELGTSCSQSKRLPLSSLA